MAEASSQMVGVVEAHQALEVVQEALVGTVPVALVVEVASAASSPENFVALKFRHI